MNTQIRTNKTTSKKASNIGNSMNIELEQTSRVLPYGSLFDKVDLYSIFTKERSESDNYRLIITINPLLTNVLFNTNTEIIKGEGSKDVTLIDNRVTIKDGYDEETGEDIKIYGDRNPNRLKMIQNTEYTKKGLDYQYHCGYDIFNNHLLRTTSFKCVNMPKKNGETDFNTIRDFMRYSDGDDVLFNRRIDVETKPELNLKKHLYDYEDILTIEDSINNNLIEENGWFGFTNGMKVNTRIVGSSASNGTIYKETLDINKPMNNLTSCEFIDMYPDRSLYSFIPKVNRIQKRLEYNWKYCLTYPYKNLTNHTLIYGNGVNGLKCQYIIKQKGYNGGDVFLFRMLLPHNLKSEDKFYLYYNSTKISTPLTVGDVGDLNKKNKKYIFYVNGTEIQEALGLTGDTYNDVEVLNKAMNDSNEFRITKLVGDFESEYYIRLFRKLPNFRYAKEIPTDDNINELTDELIKNKKTTFDSEIYQLGFASTIFNDKSAQITFTDDVNLTSLKDNLGRPLSEIYLTIVKNNKGWKSWYGDVTQEGITANGCVITIGSYDKTVSNDGGTVKIPIYSKTNIGDSIGWRASNGQSGNDGDNLVLSIPKCDKYKEDGGCSYTYTVSGDSAEFSCSETIELIQVGNDKVVPECNECVPRYHTASGWHGLPSDAYTVTVQLYTSCFKNTPNPWTLELIDRETGKKATWATATPSSGAGYCCPDWDCGLVYDKEKKEKCIASTPEVIKIAISKNESKNQRTLDFKLKTVGYCEVSNDDYIVQNGDPSSDGCPKKYAMFKDARTITNFPQAGSTISEGINIYCKEGDVTPTFEVKGAEGVKITGSGKSRSIEIPENTGTTSRTITITIHPNVDEAIVTKSLSMMSDDVVYEGTKVYKNGELYSDYEEDNKITPKIVEDYEEKQKDIKNEAKNNSFNEIKTVSQPLMFNGKERDVKSILDIEYSHCFGVVTSGFKILEHLSVPEKGVQTPETHIMESDVTLLHNIPSYKNQSSRRLEYDITIDGAETSTVTDEINNHNDLFLGDVVEFNKIDAKETVLDSVYHRFNTNQREHEFTGSTTFTQFHWDEFISDDYDPDGFKVTSTATTVDDKTNLRPEGYYYKPHYPIPLKELSTQVYQDSVLKIIPSKTESYGNDLMLITTSQKHHFIEGENVNIVTLDSNKNDLESYICNIYSVINDIKFVLNFKDSSMSFGSLTSGLINGSIELRKFNSNIPSYAFSLKDGSGRYVWREVNRIGNISNTVLKEEDYPFTNDAFYYYKNINFFLRRQDPHNIKGLYTDDKFPNDVIGSAKPENNYDYVNEEDIVC